MTDTSYNCKIFAQSPCTNQATQEDLLCDVCRTPRTHLAPLGLNGPEPTSHRDLSYLTRGRASADLPGCGNPSLAGITTDSRPR